MKRIGLLSKKVKKRSLYSFKIQRNTRENRRTQGVQRGYRGTGNTGGYREYRDTGGYRWNTVGIQGDKGDTGG